MKDNSFLCFRQTIRIQDIIVYLGTVANFCFKSVEISATEDHFLTLIARGLLMTRYVS